MDPIALMMAARNEDTDSIKRVSHENYRILSYLLLTPCRSTDLSSISPIIKSIHLQSPLFDAKLLLKTFYSECSKS